MGVCFGHQTYARPKSFITKKLVSLIEKDNSVQLKSLLSVCRVKTSEGSSKEFNYSEKIIDGMNALEFALSKGSSSCFLALVKSGKVSLKNLGGLEERPIDLICMNGLTEILALYLPTYMASSHKTEDSLFFETGSRIINQENLQQKFTPIQYACQHNQLGVIKYLVSYFKGKEIPLDFDVHFVNEDGENCALIACKTGSLNLIKYLHSECNANFHLANKNYEGALQLLAVNAKNSSRQCLNSLVYLIETVKVDPTFLFEETLLILQQEKLITYFIEKLNENGVSTTKEYVEEMNRFRFDTPGAGDLENIEVKDILLSISP